MAFVTSLDHPVVQEKLTRLRIADTAPHVFRQLVDDLARLLVYEATRDLETLEVKVQTPLQVARGVGLKERIGLVPILRAGLGMVDAALRMLPDAEVWHLGLSRDEQTLKPSTYYHRLPALPRFAVALILDPMLATGGSAVAAVKVLTDAGVQRIKFVGILGAPEGVGLLSRAYPAVQIYLAAVDERLNEHGFILPGLGDAGDRQFGTS
jgi:uracil phosphoribosyltransferase